MSESALLINTRYREVWTQDDRKIFDRAAEVVNTHGDKLKLLCGRATCPDPHIVLAVDDTNPGGRVLRCACTDRAFTPKPLPRRRMH